MLWSNETEQQFFTEALRNFAAPEQLFYNIQGDNYAYVPKGIDGEGQTLQSRNSLIGQFTERWTRNLLDPIARESNLYAVNGVICEEIGLPNRSSADLAFCTSNSVNQTANNIKIIFEIKMSVVSNYRYLGEENIEFIGDYKTHKGNPALLRSDSMLKAIGKAINIRVSGVSSTKIPIVILGNSPITDSYVHKVDYLKTAGVIQGFLSLNPNPTNTDHLRNTPNSGFRTIETVDVLREYINALLNQDINYFSSMVSKRRLGEIITIASRETTDVAKAERFLELIREQ
ncbi:MAG: hypothetical protein A2V66_15615 [Ignavibacteria bacterium RBG_13_36_8]|nr:MAG: hypothetical protein A2V66_15615 [Ignavibacteria bacterium RBG_13_36_8]